MYRSLLIKYGKNQLLKGVRIERSIAFRSICPSKIGTRYYSQSNSGGRANEYNIRPVFGLSLTLAAAISAILFVSPDSSLLKRQIKEVEQKKLEEVKDEEVPSSVASSEGAPVDQMLQTGTEKPEDVMLPEGETDHKTVGATEEEVKKEGAYDPETGEINWDCPCLGGMADGPCGEEFKEAFSCFIYSEADPKGIDCVDKFQHMQDCFRKYPEHYAEQIKDEDEAAQITDETSDQQSDESVQVTDGASDKQSEVFSEDTPEPTSDLVSDPVEEIELTESA